MDWIWAAVVAGLGMYIAVTFYCLGWLHSREYQDTRVSRREERGLP